MAEYHGYLLCYNGARMIDYSTGKILFDQTLSVAEELAVLKHLKQFKGVHPIIDLGEYMLVEDVYDGMITLNGKPFNVIQYESRGNHFLLKEVKDLSSYLDVPVNKILTFGDPEYLQEHYQAMMEPFKDTLSCMFTGPFYFEFMPQGIDKAKALKTVFGNDGYQPEDMIAFGDGQNDVSMIRYAGLGIGMANAVDELKEAADELTSSCDEDGIAEALYRHLPELK
jgi:Cof subfamily protein (haloacid dehalogenase superfamily)